MCCASSVIHRSRRDKLNSSEKRTQSATPQKSGAAFPQGKEKCWRSGPTRHPLPTCDRPASRRRERVCDTVQRLMLPYMVLLPCCCSPLDDLCDVFMFAWMKFALSLATRTTLITHSTNTLSPPATVPCLSAQGAPNGAHLSVTRTPPLAPSRTPLAMRQVQLLRHSSSTPTAHRLAADTTTRTMPTTQQPTAAISRQAPQ